MKDYKKILEGVVNIINTAEKSDIGFANICTYIGENCPELKESEDEKWIHKGNIEYRIKPESAYRPFESAQECIEEMKKHEPFGWVKSKPDVGDYCSSIIDIRYVSAFNFIKLRGSWLNSNSVFENYTFLDGSQFGIKVEDKEE